MGPVCIYDLPGRKIKPPKQKYFGGNWYNEFRVTSRILWLVTVVPVISWMGVVIDLFESCSGKVRINLGR